MTEWLEAATNRVQQNQKTRQETYDPLLEEMILKKQNWKRITKQLEEGVMQLKEELKQKEQEKGGFHQIISHMETASNKPVENLKTWQEKCRKS